jgi:probable F420-dependent oxidoreductase
MLARQIATLDVLSDGRAEIGIGAGHTGKEFRQAGIPFDAASVRIGRLEESLIVLKGLLGAGPFSFSGQYYNIDGLELSPAPVQRPRPPLLVGGSGRKLLAVAARQADIVAIAPQAPWGRPVDARMEMLGPAIAAKVDWIREQAGDRFSQIEISGRLTAVVTTDRAAGARRCRDLLQVMFPVTGREITEAEILQSPCYAVGTPEQICDHLRQVRERYDISHFTLYGTEPEAFAAAVHELQGN